MLHKIQAKQLLKADRDTVWEFMSDPGNLARITPQYMGFNVLTDLNGRSMYQGQIIEYTVRPLLGIPLHWVTEITHVKPKEYFVDEQRFGPYTFWHHQHWILPHANGVEMFDEVHYRLPLGPLGRIANSMFIKKQLEGIFNHRFQVLETIFNKK
jgi:ligand-binding SRPBCC domain-containing protein